MLLLRMPVVDGEDLVGYVQFLVRCKVDVTSSVNFLLICVLELNFIPKIVSILAMSTSLLVGEFGSAFASCASGFIVVLVACMTIFYLFRGSIQDPDSKRRPLSIFSINHSATQSAKSANQKIKHKLNKPSAGKRGAKCSAGAPHSPKGIVKKSDTEAVHQRSSPPPTLKSEDAKPLTVEQTVTPKTTPIEDTIENLCTVHPVELGPETSVSSEPPAQPPPPQQQQAAKKPQVKKQSSTRGNNQKKSVEFHGSGNVSATVVGNALPSVTHVSALTDMQAKVKLLEKLVKVSGFHHLDSKNNFSEYMEIILMPHWYSG